MVLRGYNANKTVNYTFSICFGNLTTLPDLVFGAGLSAFTGLTWSGSSVFIFLGLPLFKPLN